MNTSDFKISINKYYDIMRNILIYVLISIAVLGLFEIVPALTLFLGTFVFIIGSLFLYFKKVKQKYKILSVQENHLTIEENHPIEIDYLKIKSITLKYGGVKGTSWLGVVYSPIAIPNTGQENTIKIITKDGETIVRNVWCEKGSDYWRLISLGNFLKDKGIEVKMKGFLGNEPEVEYP